MAQKENRKFHIDTEIVIKGKPPKPFSSTSAAKNPLKEKPMFITKIDGTKKELPTMVVKPMEDPKKAEEFRKNAKKILEDLGIEEKPEKHENICGGEDDDGIYCF